MSVQDSKKKIEDRAKEIWRVLLNAPAGEGLGGVNQKSNDELWEIAYEMSKQENPTENAEIAADAAGKDLGAGKAMADSFANFRANIKDDGGDTSGNAKDSPNIGKLLQDIYYDKNGSLVKGKSATADIVAEARQKQGLPLQGYSGESFTFPNPLTGKIEVHQWDGTQFKPIMVDGNQVNVNSLAVFDSRGNNLAIKEGYTGTMASPTLYGGGEAPDAGDGGSPFEGGGTPKGNFDQGGTGGMPPTGGTGGTGGVGGTGGYNPNLTRDPNAAPQYMDSWRNMQPANRPTSEFTGTGQATQVSPYDAGGMFDPLTATTPYEYSKLLGTANMPNVAAPFQQPFQDYLNRAQLSYGLMDPIRAGEQGAGGFARYIAGQPQLASGQDMWSQVQNLMGGYSDLDPRAQDQIASAFGIGAIDPDTGMDSGREQRAMLAAQLQSYDVNPLLRRAQAGRLAKDYARASLGNQMYRDNPLAYALEQRTGFVAPQLQQKGFWDSLQMPSSALAFDPTGDPTPTQIEFGSGGGW